MIFPNNTRKVMFQRNFFRKTIFSGRPEKENMVFHAVTSPAKTYLKMRLIMKKSIGVA